MTKCSETRREQRRGLTKAYRNHIAAWRMRPPRNSPILCGRGAMRKGQRGYQHSFARTRQIRLNAMNLDVNTLFLVTIYVEAILGLLLLFAWVQNTAIYAVAWWGFADLLRAASIMLFGKYGSVPDLVSIDLANAILFTAFAVTWTGARVFDHRKPNWILLFAGAALWLVLYRIP